MTRPDWPADLRGVTESVVATLGPNDRWNQAALGLHAPVSEGGGGGVSDGGGDVDGGVSDGGGEGNGDGGGDGDAPVTATTWGRTRTRRNFEREGGGVVQFTSDPREFVDAALSVFETEDPVLPGADAWATVDATRVETGESGGTEWARWELRPTDGRVIRETVPTINRGFAAVVEATVAASRLDVDAYDTEALLDRLAHFAETVERCGGPREREAFARVGEYTGWREY